METRPASAVVDLGRIRESGEAGRASGDMPLFGGNPELDAQAAAAYVDEAEDGISALPAKRDRSPSEQDRVCAVQEKCRAVRWEFLRTHVDHVYAQMTGDFSRFVRLEDLVFDVATAFPWLAPVSKDIARERECEQADKEGLEVDQALLVTAVLSSSEPARHLIRAMLQPTSEAMEFFPDFARTGVADLGAAHLERRDGVAYVEVRNDRYLNAEDDGVVAALETAVDLALLDDACSVGVLRGAPVSHRAYAGRRVFSSGINLTDLYYGQISYVDFLMRRELGLLHKMFRGHWLRGDLHEADEQTREMAWVGAVDAFAIGGGLQILVVMDQVVAEDGAYFSLPALREGIIPGTGNLRLARVAGERLTKQLIFADRRVRAEEPEGRLLCDHVVPTEAMDDAIAERAARLAGSATVGNRRLLRLAQEPVATYQKYLARYAWEQVGLLYGTELIQNLRRGWLARPRGQ